MPIYRCFCMTADNRIITGAKLEAKNLGAVVASATTYWHNVVGFHHVDVWLGRQKLDADTVPAAEPAPSSGAVLYTPSAPLGAEALSPGGKSNPYSCNAARGTTAAGTRVAAELIDKANAAVESASVAQDPDQPVSALTK